MSKNIKRHNHFVPQMYLRNWSQGKTINTYSLLVPHLNVPLWKNNSIEYSASIDNLYVRNDQGRELDDFEEEYMKYYETPAKEPLIKACQNQRLTREEWHNLIDFIAAQIVRTPAFYFKIQELMVKVLPEVMGEIGRELDQLTSEQIKSPSNIAMQEKSLLPYMINFVGRADDNHHELAEISVLAGKSIWLFAMKHLLSRTSLILHQHKWSIITAADGVFWPTSDDPVICLNKYINGGYDFNGGWGKIGCEIIMPICPTKAIYTQVGIKHPSRIDLNYKQSMIIKKLIVEHAFMYVYSYVQDRDIQSFRPRTVDLDEYTRIKSEFEEWYKKYQEKEVPYLQPHLYRDGEQIL